MHAYRRIGFQAYWSEKDFELDDMNREMLSDASLYGLPGLVLELLEDHRSSYLTLVDTPPGLAVRPLPGMELLVTGGQALACRSASDHLACEGAAAWLAAVETLAQDLFSGRQHALSTPAVTSSPEPGPL